MSDRAHSWRTALPVVVVVAVAAAGAWWVLGDGADDAAAPVAIDADGPRYSTLDDLAAASDVVVVGTVVRVDEGRAITDPADPGAGIRTQLATVEVRELLAGESSGPLIVEQEAALLDGTPIVVDGVVPLVVGDTGALFVVRGDSDEFPYTAFVNEQGWLPIVDDVLTPIDPTDPVWSPLAGRSGHDLAENLTD